MSSQWSPSVERALAMGMPAYAAPSAEQSLRQIAENRAAREAAEADAARRAEEERRRAEQERRDREARESQDRGGQADASAAALMRELQQLRDEMARRPDPVQVARQERERNRAAIMATVSWLPSDLIDQYVGEWVRSGQSELAWAVVRQSPAYDRHFAGIRRDDGTLRMTEQDYMSHKDAFQRELRQWGLNPELFEGHHARLVEGEVSAQEFRQRIDAKATGVLQNLPEIRERFGQFYGISELTDEALIASALDPEIGRQVLQGRITAAQISGEASRFGFERGREASERLAQVGGLDDQMRARDFFAGAARAVPRMQRFSERFEQGRPSFGIEQYEEAGLFGTTELQRRMRRLHASEMAMFQQGPSVTIDQGGAFTGLGRR